MHCRPSHPVERAGLGEAGGLSRRAAHRCAGLSLAELILGLAGMVLVASAVAMMVNAVAYGTDSGRDMRGLVVRHKTITARIGAAIRSSQMILAQGNDYLVLWLHDANEDDLPNLSEIQMIERHSGTGDLYSYQAPANLAPGSDAQYTLATNFKNTLDALKGGANFPGQRWGTNITAWEMGLDYPTAQASGLVSYRLTLQAGTLSDVAIGAAALRNP